MIAMKWLLVLALLVFSGCATTGAFSKCDPIVYQCNEADYPPLFNMLPPWPFPRLFKALPEEPTMIETVK